MDNIFDGISARLSEAGMDDASVEACKKALLEEFAGLSGEELEKKLESRGGADGITASLLDKYEAAKKNKKDNELNIINIDDDMFSDESEEESEPQPEIINTGDEASKTGSYDVDKVVSEIDEGGRTDSVKADEYFNDDDDDVKVKQPAKKKTAKKPQDLPVKSNDIRNPAAAKKKKTSVKNMTPRAKTAYIIGLCILIPLLVALVIVITVLFLALYAAIIALVIAFSVALVVIAAVGTALSLMAIIFGVIQLIQGAAAPIGIYEIGLGVAAGGITLGVSILLYNFIVRLAPFLFKKMFVLYKFLFRQLTKLLGFVKGACSKL